MSNDDILREFVIETHENLALLDADLLTLERNPHQRDTLAQVFRTLHSVKGTAGFMGLVRLQAVAHASENLLSRLRAGEIGFTPAIATALLQVVDAIRAILSHIETSGEEGEGDYAALIAEVDRLRESGDGAHPAATTLLQVDHSAPSPAPPAPTPASVATTQFLPIDLRPTEAAPPVPTPASAATTQELPIDQRPTEAAPPMFDQGAPKTTDAAEDASVEARPASAADASIRVDVGLLDKLMTLMGELVLARNQILRYSASQEDSGFLDAVQRLNRLTTELQGSVMKTRMQPVGNVLNKFPRVVRDLALACGKKVSLELEGQDTELDKTLLEAIRDPLTHLVRNAIDHGIETPDVRKSLGKPETGRVRMVAFHEGGKVIIELTDDGAGIDVDRVREKAIQARVVPADVVARMSRQEILQLIFLPGFSTAQRVTQFSGRGVGMDVVRTNIEKIGGAVEIESVSGQGTTIRTKIPLTLTIIPSLIVASGGEQYVIPQVSLLELLRIEADHAERGIERMHGAPVYRLRGSLLPLVFLNEQLQIPPQSSPSQDVNIVVLQADDRPFGLVVDGIRDTEEIIVKPLQKLLKGVTVFSGAAIMGDGRVALVLDVLDLAQRAGAARGSKSRALTERERPPSPTPAEHEPLLLFATRGGGQMAVPLSQVARLEEFPHARLEHLGARQVVQYRGEILPLIDVSEQLDYPRRPVRSSNGHEACAVAEEAIAVVVCADGKQAVGLMVGKILDIVHEPVAQRSHVNRPGVRSTTVVQDRVTEIIDVAALLRDAAPEA
jgi:two-component system chemotaxis sensor kinase CheA